MMRLSQQDVLYRIIGMPFVFCASFFAYIFDHFWYHFQYRLNVQRSCCETGAKPLPRNSREKLSRESVYETVAKLLRNRCCRETVFRTFHEAFCGAFAMTLRSCCETTAEFLRKFYEEVAKLLRSYCKVRAFSETICGFMGVWDSGPFYDIIELTEDRLVVHGPIQTGDCQQADGWFTLIFVAE